MESPALAPSAELPEWMTPRQLARHRQIRVEKVLNWIKSRELEAINMAASLSSKPRWKVSKAALEAFDRGRSNRAFVAPPVLRRRKESALLANGEKDFFKSGIS